MLVLTRKRGEGVLIGENVRVVVLLARDGKCRLAIDAPEDVLILRDELAHGRGPGPNDPSPGEIAKKSEEIRVNRRERTAKIMEPEQAPVTLKTYHRVQTPDGVVFKPKD